MKSSKNVFHSNNVTSRLSPQESSVAKLASMELKIKKLREKRGWTQDQLAEVSGLSRSYIAAIENRNIDKSPSIEASFKLSKSLGVRIGELFSDVRPVSIVGKVGAGAKVPLFDASQDGDGLYQVACPSELPFDKEIVGIEIEGDSMQPVYKEGDVLFFSRDSFSVPTEAVGSICICEDENGDAWVKQVKLGSERGKFNLISFNPSANNMHDVTLKWAAPVSLHWPKHLVERM